MRKALSRVLPRMMIGDWIFWAVIVLLGINLIWLGVLEEHAPLWVGWIIGGVLAFIILRYAPRVGEEGGEEE
ncbi:MAG: hypothetical protein JW732_04235 [Dehalococcoidia bacterium]|nr:hypothetical protein [Dehalococcoidia bacterium]